MLFNGTDTGAPLKHALLSYNISHGLSIHIFEKIAETTTKIQEKEKSMIGKYTAFFQVLLDLFFR